MVPKVGYPDKAILKQCFRAINDACTRPCVRGSVRACVEACVHLRVCLRSLLEDLNSSTTKNKKQNKTFLAHRVHTHNIPKTLSENTARDERCYASLKRLKKLQSTYISENSNFYFGSPISNFNERPPVVIECHSLRDRGQ